MCWNNTICSQVKTRIMNKKISPTRLKLVYEPIESLVGLFYKNFCSLLDNRIGVTKKTYDNKRVLTA